MQEKNKYSADENLKKNLIEYYKDQISYYTKRQKNYEKSIADKKRVGLPITFLDELAHAEEMNNVNRFKERLHLVENSKDSADAIKILLKQHPKLSFNNS